MKSRTSTLLASALLIGGCAQTGTRPESAATARQIEAMEATTVGERAGVDIVVEADAWTGDRGVTAEVTPLRVRLANRGERPLLIRYSEFALIDPDGDVYRALPPFRVNGTVAASPTGTYSPIATPGFAHQDFFVADLYSTIYPRLSVAAEPLLTDPKYYEQHYGYWRQTALPTAQMLELAIPEGVLEAGGELAGFLYFEKVPDDEQLRMRYRANLVDPHSGVTFARVSIPFVTEPLG